MLKYLLFFIAIIWHVDAQNLYFPPVTGNQWETTNPLTLGWCPEPIDELYQYLENENTKAFLVLKDGKIVLEKYFGTFTRDSSWYWASAGKSMTAFLIGMAQQEGKLKLSDSSSKYLGKGWTSCTETEESFITIRHQLTMTTGLDDRNVDLDCTLPECLKCFKSPGERWSYHNAPYTLLDGVIENASGQTINQFLSNRLYSTTGMACLYLRLGYNNVLFSKPRIMARFGLLMLNKGNWNGQPILTDMDYFNDMIHSSQNFNKSYGYLWWLNGQESYMAPGLQFVFNGSLSPSGPDDMYSALGKNGQILSIVPSQNIIVVRMGDAPNTGLVPFTMVDSIWRRLNQIICIPNHTQNGRTSNQDLQLIPNPASDYFTMQMEEIPVKYEVYNSYGQRISQNEIVVSNQKISTQQWSNGIYWLKVYLKNGQSFSKSLLISR
ncbi:MAG: serine hydrolase [Saprospiraceae bacterium]|nr:serine hydrolase [Saprospiraceae bacterium]